MLDQETINTLFGAAKTAMANAYAPYSKFTVGAALLMKDGQIVTGCNIENASFGVTACAERSAISAAISNGVSDIQAVCVTNATDTKITPCGICRQAIYEFGRDIPVICTNQSGDYDIFSIAELLPHAFTLD